MQNVLTTLSPLGDEASEEFIVRFYESGCLRISRLHNAQNPAAFHATIKNPDYCKPGFRSPYVLVEKWLTHCFHEQRNMKPEK